MPRRGENIFKRKDGRWEARYIHHYEYGKAKYRFLYADTYTEVKAKRNEELKQHSTGTAVIKTNMSFKDIAYLWLGEMQDKVKESTYARYERNLRVYLLPLLGKKNVNHLENEFLKHIHKKLLDSGGKDGKPLSAKTVCDILCVLKGILKYAKANGYSFLDTDIITFPKQYKKPAEILSEEDRLKIENRLWDSGDTISLGILFTIYTGVRIGELCGLRWADIDFQNGVVHICRTVQRIPDTSANAKAKTKVIISKPKTQNSDRFIPIPKFLLDHLAKHRCDMNSYLVTGTRNYTEPHQFYLRYHTFLRKMGVQPYTFHTLRHTFATRCVEHGFDTKSLSEILGHGSIGTTLSLYVHPTLEQKRKQMERLMPCI